jgi:hypothetical protein
MAFATRTRALALAIAAVFALAFSPGTAPSAWQALPRADWPQWGDWQLISP